MVQIIKDYVPISSNHRPGIKRTGFRGVTIHETGNRSKGAGAVSHNTYYHNLAKSNTAPAIGYHYFVDDKVAYLEHPSDEIAWTNGDGSGDGNMKTVSVEICVNPESNFVVARDNGAYVAAVELHANGIRKVIDGVANKANGNLFQHWCWSSYKKNCPETIRNQGLWPEFVKATQNHLDALWGVASAPVSVSPTTTKTIAVGSAVRVTGTTYATGQQIPGWVKASTLTVHQINGDKALVKPINSWIYIKDLEVK